MPKPIQRVKFTKAFERNTKIRDQNPSLGYILPRVNFISVASNERKNLRIGPLEETSWQEQGARDAAWKLAKSVFQIKGA